MVSTSISSTRCGLKHTFIAVALFVFSQTQAAAYISAIPSISAHSKRRTSSSSRIGRDRPLQTSPSSSFYITALSNFLRHHFSLIPLLLFSSWPPALSTFIKTLSCTFPFISFSSDRLFKTECEVYISPVACTFHPPPPLLCFVHYFVRQRNHSADCTNNMVFRRRFLVPYYKNQHPRLS